MSAVKQPPTGSPPRQKEIKKETAAIQQISTNEILKLEYDRKTTTNEIAIVIAEPLLTKVEKTGRVIIPFRRLMPKLSCACRILSGRTKLASPEKKAARIEVIDA